MWDWGFFLRDAGGGRSYLHWLLSAWGWTLAVSAVSFLLAVVVGAAVGVLRTLPHRGWAACGDAWTELFRNVPLLVQIFIWYHVLPAMVPAMVALPSFLLVVVAIGFFTSARIAEQVKAGIESLPRGQRDAGLAMGLTLAQTYRFVLLPSAFRIVIPPLTSESMSVIKNSSVAFAVSISELTTFAIQAQEETARGIEVYLVVTAAYFVSAFAVNRLARRVEQHLQTPGMHGAPR